MCDEHAMKAHTRVVELCLSTMSAPLFNHKAKLNHSDKQVQDSKPSGNSPCDSTWLLTQHTRQDGRQATQQTR